MGNAQQFEADLAHREAVRDRIDSISKQLGHAPNLGVLASQAGEEQERVTGYLQQCGREDLMDSQQKQNLTLYRQRHEIANRQYLDAKRVQEPLRAELTTLQAELGQLDCSCSLQELLSIQEEMVTVKHAAERIRQAIADQESKVAAAWASIPSIDALTKQRQELLAQKEIGQEVDAALAAVEQELDAGKQAAQEARTEAEAVKEQAEEVIAGLHRMLETKESRAKVLHEVVQPNAVKSYLLVQLESIGAEYAKAAETLTVKFRRLVALSNILINRDEKDRDALPWKTAQHLRLPVFPTASCQGLSAEPIKWYNPDAIEVERQELRRLGVQL